MFASSIKSIFLLAAAAVALPTSGSNQTKPFIWDGGAVSQFPIHSSCNATQRRQIEVGLSEAVFLAAHARDHILRWRNESEIYRKYFGDSPSMEPIGAYDVVVNGDRKHSLFRCDNPDGNCDIEDYAGHWRGENGTDETVICDLSYETRRSLSTMCSLGYTVSGSETNTFWASDLLHRLFHVPTFGQNHIDHFADGYEEVVDQAIENVTLSTHDSETLQYFALEVYAYDIAVPGVGCPGKQHEHEHSSENSSSQSTSTSAGTSAATEAATTTSDAPKNCHTHEGGELHCT
ncbi:hypothetical protein N7532_009569 [Penicillium argentinense]|uniref:Putative peptidase domain-containing protein n=1 Tax=Penicillium argentinense TaxID=1131581 RepID=A0A9W9K2Z8_9EURO|nr:uncharacterized protein N7532_009569 [Penicillium argentinense]KAJ5090885.1 hypothetical protein N7532_009569 [Penicillium argentinense]